ncbi:MAG: ATP-binding protein [Nevskia sp.]|nr:ATP-binding protein [Nevskia sp.]
MSPEASQAESQDAAGHTDIAALRRVVTPIGSDTRVEQLADIIQRGEYAGLLCLPVVDDGRPLGTISRNQLTDIFLLRFGRELYGSRSAAEVMNRAPLIVADDLSLEDAAKYVAANIGSPISEDFIITRNGRYDGMGVVIDLLGAMQTRLAHNARQLAQAYRQLQSSQAALVQSEKMASLGQMVAGVAHEINTPLGYVRNNVDMIQGVFGQLRELLGEYDRLAQMLTDDGADEQALGRQLVTVTSAARELHDSGVLDDTAALFGDTLFGVDSIKELATNLRNFSRLDAAKVAEVSLNDCLDQTLVIANHALKGKVKVLKRYGDIPRISCSPSQINQVLLNMVTNAVQAIDHDGGKLLLQTKADGAWLRVRIQDNGKGIRPEHLPRIFDPFFTTKPIGQGTGLGLSISYQIVEAHGGRIEVASAVGKGTRFVVSLPLEPPTHSTAAAQAAASSNRGTR